MNILQVGVVIKRPHGVDLVLVPILESGLGLGVAFGFGFGFGLRVKGSG